eukprot:COSAG02_NODE_3143_length_7292_cov_20.803698_4_plen_148_part_00
MLGGFHWLTLLGSRLSWAWRAWRACSDYGWSEAGWHRNYTIGGLHVPATDEVQTPQLDELVRNGIELDRAYAYKCCSPTRSALQSGRHPYHVNALNAAMEISNPADPVSGYAGVPRNMTGMATKLAAAGCELTASVALLPCQNRVHC